MSFDILDLSWRCYCYSRRSNNIQDDDRASKISTDDVDHVIERLDEVVDSIIESKEQANDTGN